MSSPRETFVDRPANHIRHLSPARSVSMGEEWFELAHADHFWMKRRFEVLSILCGQRLRRQPRCAEIGCGSGVIQSQIEQHYDLAVDGFDLHLGALERNRTTRGQLYYYDVTERHPDFRERYDLIFLFDVLEHVEQDAEFVQSCKFHLRTPGTLVINVPARQELFSRYDQAAGHVRRYNLKTLQELANRTGLRLVESTYWGLLLYPLLWTRKILHRNGSDAEILRAGFHPQRFNDALLRVARTEWIPQRILGTSLLAVFDNARA